MPWYFFAFLTPLLYTITNYIEKYLLENRIKNPIVILVIGGIINLTIGLGVLIVTGFPKLGPTNILMLLGAGLLLKYYLIPYLYALKLEDASVVVPLFQVVPIIVITSLTDLSLLTQ